MRKTFLLVGLLLSAVSVSAQNAVSWWFDQQTERHQYNSSTIDCSGLSDGFHSIHFQAVDCNGDLCPTQTAFFLLMDRGPARMYYWFDDSVSQARLIPIDETQIDVSALGNGHHTISVRLADRKGNILDSEVLTAKFTVVCPEEQHVDADGDWHCDICGEIPTGVGSVKDSYENSGYGYGLDGIRVPNGTKTITVIGGKKYLNR